MTAMLKAFFQLVRKKYSDLPTSVKYLVIFSLVVGSILRFVNLFNLGLLFDMVGTQYLWGKSAFEMGYFGFWKDYQGFFDYTPLSLLLELVLYTISLPFGGSAQNFVTLMKLLNWFVEIVLVGLLLDFAFGKKIEVEEDLKGQIDNKKYSQRAFIVAALAYILPSLWFVSGVWGQNDTLIALLSFLVIKMMYRVDLESLPKAGYWQALKDPMLHAGILWALAFWIKQQAILILPVVFVFHLYKKSWKAILMLSASFLPFVVSAALAFRYYSQGQWQDAAGLGFATVVIGFLVVTALLSRVGVWTRVLRQIWGFMVVSLLILSPLLLINYQRVGQTAFAVVGRSDNVSNGAATFWSLLGTGNQGSDALIRLGNLSLSISQSAYLIYIVLMTFLVFRVLGLSWKRLWKKDLVQFFTKKLSYYQAIYLLTLSSALYFLFFTKMHSRYLHFAIVFSLFASLIIAKFKHWKFWLGALVVMHLGYFLNQTSIFTLEIVGLKSTDPIWVDDFNKIFEFSRWQFSALLTFVSTMIMYYLIWQKTITQNLQELDNK